MLNEGHIGEFVANRPRIDKTPEVGVLLRKRRKRGEELFVVAVCFLNCLYNNKERPSILSLRLHLGCKLTEIFGVVG